MSVGDEIEIAPEEEIVRKGAKVGVALTQEGVETSRLPEPESDVLLVEPAGKDGQEHVPRMAMSLQRLS